ncbi:anoctamin-5-like [Diaphorina citri]|uniref:Anoctamin n=1 Tax=Diaphorina citri TaxID=121845 RepID=A0A1S3D351_DIACI|nr:anoctamin-5-like [Diaphorina citri]
MPMKSYDDTDGSTKKFNILSEAANFVVLFIKLCIAIEPANMPMKKLPLTAQYTKAKHYLFDEENSDFLSPPSRSLIIDFILSRQSFTANNKDLANVGIQRLIEDGIYKAAYPLHDGDWATGDPEKSLRYSLYKEWAHLRNWIKNQPADQIKEYLGVKCAFYFVWLGFYTHMLIPASILGLTVFLYGVFTLNNDSLSRDICNKTLNIIMCPLCDRTCDYWKLSDTCKSARVTYLFDNTFSVIFAFLMSIWAVLFLESWKRYSAAITHRWGLTHFTLEAEHPRPSYLARLSHLKRTKTIMNIITGTEEPRAPFWIRWPTRILSFSVVLILIMCALATVVGVVLYRMSLYATLSLSHKADWMNSYGIVIIPFTAACINLVCIQILNLVYARLATYMTEFEYLRTQTEFDESLAIKIYLFQFVNYYTSIFYIAFLKGKFIGYPAKYTRVFNLRQEECSPGGCFMELSIQLAVIMVGQQTFNSIVEMFIPYFWKLYNVFMITTGLSDDLSETEKNADLINLRETQFYAGSLYPHQVRICTGSLITPHWILSAAHCFVVSGRNEFTVRTLPPDLTEIRAHYLNNNQSSPDFYYTSPARKVHIHPEYIYKIRNDLSLIMSSLHFPLLPTLAPIPLSPVSFTKFYEDCQAQHREPSCTIVGYGEKYPNDKMSYVALHTMQIQALPAYRCPFRLIFLILKTDPICFVARFGRFESRTYVKPGCDKVVNQSRTTQVLIVKHSRVLSTHSNLCNDTGKGMVGDSEFGVH